MALSKPMQALDVHLSRQTRRDIDRIFTEPRQTQWCVRYRYVQDHPWHSTTHRSQTPQALVQFMRDNFNGNKYVAILGVWSEDV